MNNKNFNVSEGGKHYAVGRDGDELPICSVCPDQIHLGSPVDASVDESPSISLLLVVCLLESIGLIIVPPSSRATEVKMSGRQWSSTSRAGGRTPGGRARLPRKHAGTLRNGEEIQKKKKKRSFVESEVSCFGSPLKRFR
jgi:hypothetical protein